MMKPDKNFRLSKTTKRILATLSGDKQNEYKNLMIQSQLHSTKVRTQKLKTDKPTKNDAA